MRVHHIVGCSVILAAMSIKVQFTFAHGEFILFGIRRINVYRYKQNMLKPPPDRLSTEMRMKR